MAKNRRARKSKNQAPQDPNKSRSGKSRRIGQGKAQFIDDKGNKQVINFGAFRRNSRGQFADKPGGNDRGQYDDLWSINVDKGDQIKKKKREEFIKNFSSSQLLLPPARTRNLNTLHTEANKLGLKSEQVEKFGNISLGETWEKAIEAKKNGEIAEQIKVTEKNNRSKQIDGKTIAEILETDRSQLNATQRQVIDEQSKYDPKILKYIKGNQKAGVVQSIIDSAINKGGTEEEINDQIIKLYYEEQEKRVKNGEELLDKGDLILLTDISRYKGVKETGSLENINKAEKRALGKENKVARIARRFQDFKTKNVENLQKDLEKRKTDSTKNVKDGYRELTSLTDVQGIPIYDLTFALKEKGFSNDEISNIMANDDGQPVTVDYNGKTITLKKSDIQKALANQRRLETIKFVKDTLGIKTIDNQEQGVQIYEIANTLIEEGFNLNSMNKKDREYLASSMKLSLLKDLETLSKEANANNSVLYEEIVRLSSGKGIDNLQKILEFKDKSGITSETYAKAFLELQNLKVTKGEVAYQSFIEEVNKNEKFMEANNLYNENFNKDYYSDKVRDAESLANVSRTEKNIAEKLQDINLILKSKEAVKILRGKSKKLLGAMGGRLSKNITRGGGARVIVKNMVDMINNYNQQNTPEKGDGLTKTNRGEMRKTIEKSEIARLTEERKKEIISEIRKRDPNKEVTLAEVEKQLKSIRSDIEKEASKNMLLLSDKALTEKYVKEFERAMEANIENGEIYTKNLYGKKKIITKQGTEKWVEDKDNIVQQRVFIGGQQVFDKELLESLTLEELGMFKNAFLMSRTGDDVVKKKVAFTALFMLKSGYSIEEVNLYVTKAKELSSEDHHIDQFIFSDLTGQGEVASINTPNHYDQDLQKKLDDNNALYNPNSVITHEDVPWIDGKMSVFDLEDPSKFTDKELDVILVDFGVQNPALTREEKITEINSLKQSGNLEELKKEKIKQIEESQKEARKATAKLMFYHIYAKDGRTLTKQEKEIKAKGLKKFVKAYSTNRKLRVKINSDEKLVKDFVEKNREVLIDINQEVKKEVDRNSSLTINKVDAFSEDSINYHNDRDNPNNPSKSLRYEVSGIPLGLTVRLKENGEFNLDMDDSLVAAYEVYRKAPSEFINDLPELVNQFKDLQKNSSDPRVDFSSPTPVTDRIPYTKQYLTSPHALHQTNFYPALHFMSNSTDLTLEKNEEKVKRLYHRTKAKIYKEIDVYAHDHMKEKYPNLDSSDPSYKLKYDEKVKEMRGSFDANASSKLGLDSEGNLKPLTTEVAFGVGSTIKINKEEGKSQTTSERAIHNLIEKDLNTLQAHLEFNNIYEVLENKENEKALSVLNKRRVDKGESEMSSLSEMSYQEKKEYKLLKEDFSNSRNYMTVLGETKGKYAKAVERYFQANNILTNDIEILDAQLAQGNLTKEEEEAKKLKRKNLDDQLKQLNDKKKGLLSNLIAYDENLEADKVLNEALGKMNTPEMKQEFLDRVNQGVYDDSLDYASTMGHFFEFLLNKKNKSRGKDEPLFSGMGLENLSPEDRKLKEQEIMKLLLKLKPE